ncbi:Zinc/iron permease [Aulographum hederae CBS 113979]|uniref:Zinc/iron permease n=1 Tax=Aulographum hederae CBS 113979 TaxID=1176131 RepID=A0A6G1GWT7_9PEZI|nr:Zinc/iron permease [Aulographum hederae CBS 113979]
MAYGGNASAQVAGAMNQKPKCGGGQADANSYDLPLHVAALFLVLFASIGGAGFPVVAKKVKWLNIPPYAFFVCKHFGTGVLIATAFVHLLPTAFESLNNPCLPDLFTVQYPPMPGVIGLGSLFSLFCIELWLHAKTGGGAHSHGGPMGEGIVGDSHTREMAAHAQAHVHDHGTDVSPKPFSRSDSTLTGNTLQGVEGEGKLEMPSDTLSLKDFAIRNDIQVDDEKDIPPWFTAFYERYIRERDEMVTAINQSLPEYKSPTTTTTTTISEDNRPKIAVATALPALPSDVEDPHAAVDPLLLKRMNLNITLLEGGILFHSVFVGMTVSITTKGFVVLLIAILFHQTFEGLGLGSRIAAVPYPEKSLRPWILVVAFGTTAPIGQAIGLATRATYDPQSAFALILVGTFNAISSGLLIYAALVDLLQQDFLSEEADRLLSMRQKWTAFGFVFLGAAGMSIVGAWA